MLYIFKITWIFFFLKSEPFIYIFERIMLSIFFLNTIHFTTNSSCKSIHLLVIVISKCKSYGFVVCNVMAYDVWNIAWHMYKP